MSNRRNAQKWENLYLLRHGESTCNEVNRFAGMIDAPLTSLGEAQARAAASYWQGPPPEIVFTSPLQRARRTADLLFPLTGDNSTQFVVDARITERNFGDFTLKNKAFIQRETGLKGYEAALYCDGAANRNEESFSRFYARTLSFLKEVLHPLLLAGKRVLVVAHKYVIELLCRLILRLPCKNGYDLRLPNAKILSGSELRAYISRELQAINLLQEWLVLHHAMVLLVAALTGILLNYFNISFNIPPMLLIGLLALSTAFSLARVNLREITKAEIASGKAFLRYLVLPLALALLVSGTNSTPVFIMALLLAAPSAITSITISRCMGGLVTPTVYLLLLSTLTGTGVLLSILTWRGEAALTGPAIQLILITLICVGVPFAAIRHLRRQYPIDTAKFGERHGGTAVILLALFVTLSFNTIRLEAFWPEGAWALAFAIILRLVALLFTRRNSLFAVDDYVTMSYPNIFLVIVLAGLLDHQILLRTATWFLLPMFGLAVFDEWLCRKFLSPREDERLYSFLKIDPAHGDLSLPETNSASHNPLSGGKEAGSMDGGVIHANARAISIYRSFSKE
jgi:ribonuclease H / adenosylcobalamin/alpha-ribazole phosphatase